MEQQIGKVRFFDSVTQQEIDTTAIEIALPNGQRFHIENLPGRDGAAVFYMPSDPERRQVSAFVIEPGGANLFAVNVASWSRLHIDGDEPSACEIVSP